MSNRDRQIQNLRHYFPSIITIAPDCYDLPFTLPSRPHTNFTLRVLFPLSFPSDPPKLQLWPRSAPSSLVDEGGFVYTRSYKGLSEWTSGSSLGLVAFEMIKLFEVHPPSPLSPSGSPSPSSSQPTVTTTTTSARTFQSMPTLSRDPQPSQHQQHQQHHHHQQQQQQQQPKPELLSQRPTPPPLPEHFPEVLPLSLQEIESLLNDEKEFEAFFFTLEGVKKVRREGEEIRTTNNHLARKNLDLFDEIDNLQAEVQSKQSELAQLLVEFEQKEKELGEVSSTHSPEGLLVRLGEYVREADEKTEVLSERFVEGEVDFDEFLKVFVKEREMYHTLAAKKESLELFMLHKEQA